jgi:nitrogen-specific signal transduction histidine kinase
MYKEAARLASTIASTTDEKKKAEALDRFWSLYWGELALVEDARVEAAMVKFGQALNSKADAQTVQKLAFNLAHECRNSLAASWGVEAWTSHRWFQPTD